MNWNRILSVIVAIIYMTSVGISEGTKEMFRACVYLLLPLGFIWFGSELGRTTGIKFGRLIGPVITKESPGCIIVFLGWVMLLMPAILALFNASMW